MIGFLSWDLHIAWLVLGGIAMVAMVVLPQLLHSRPLSVPIIYVTVAFAVFQLSDELRGPRPLGIGFDSAAIEYVTELIVIISLVGAGLRIERRPGLVRWNSVWRLLAIAMTLTVAAAIGLGGMLLGLAAAPAILLAGVLAPTDPVLADDVQLGRPDAGHDHDEVRFTLTAEAGLNDGLAFPVIHLALLVTTASVASIAGSLVAWALFDLGFRVAVGLAMGLAFGHAINVFGHRTGEFFGNQTSEGLFSLGATILVYGLTEVVNGYGFLAVFVAAMVRGTGGGDQAYRREAREFVEQIESILVAIALLGFGAIACFGIRGSGSVYYLAYAANAADFGGDALAQVWSVVSLTILLSIGVHGISASPLMRRLDLRHDDRPATVEDDDLDARDRTP